MREGEIVTGHVQRFERGNLFIDLGRATAILPYDEQIPGERYRQGERVRALLLRVDEGARGTFIRLSRSHPALLGETLRDRSARNGKWRRRGQGHRTRAGKSRQDRGQELTMSTSTRSAPWSASAACASRSSPRSSAARRSTSWNGAKTRAIIVKEALKPAQILDIELFEDESRAIVQVDEDQQSLAIGRGGQNVRLAARLTGWKIDIRGVGGESVATVAPKAETPVESTVPVLEITDEGSINTQDAFAEAKSDISGDDDEAADTGVENAEAINQDRDVPSDAVNAETDQGGGEEPSEVDVEPKTETE